MSAPSRGFGLPAVIVKAALDARAITSPQLLGGFLADFIVGRYRDNSTTRAPIQQAPASKKRSRIGVDLVVELQPDV